MSPDPKDSPPKRDAESTRRRLIEAARQRFAQDGYAGATTRDIARDAGVNLSLISRYFGGKQGLFEACVQPALEALLSSADTLSSPAGVAKLLVSELAVGKPDAAAGAMLLLRASGDEAVEALRLQALRTLSEQLATLVPPELPEEERLLRAQLTLSMGLGIAIMRSAIGLAPLCEVDVAALLGPITALAAVTLAAPEAGLGAGADLLDQRGDP
ncbi:MAG: TetR/AcrR family transcriptional regulator [Alphaproteobacteria bacterium]|nr:TetR/AcrR family transcriptional regulator [Alphaproteobacteria bacterium]